MRTLASLALSALTLTAAGTGCVMKSQYDALRADYNALQMRVSASEMQATTERATMRQQVDQYNLQAGAARSDADQCRSQMAHVLQTQAEIRTKLELAMPLLNHIVHAVSPIGQPPLPGGHPTAALPYPGRIQ